MSDEVSGWRAAAVALRQRVDAYDGAAQTEGRMHILRAFLGLATRDGYTAVTMRSLARELNIKAPSLYSHFPGGRDELVSEVLRWHHNRFYRSILEAIEGAESADAAWETLVSEHVERQLEMPEYDMIDLLIWTDRLSNILAPDVREEVAELHRLYALVFVATAVDVGHRGDTSQAVEMVMTMLDGVSRWSGWDGTAESLHGAVESARSVARAILDAPLAGSADPVGAVGMRPAAN
ncbi:TetR/AcrR family transcriptional regulator [Agromyces tropicus]|uniref:TetR/AcrR family transcriptional regulator n=1 Tax=Agromyces tropicus TaxID=555371 RepID=A0ABN2U1S1_9MICO